VSHLFRFGIYEANTGPCGSFSSGRNPDTGEIGVPAQAGGTTTSMLDAADCIAWLGANQGGIAPGHQDEDLGLPQYDPSACPNGTLPMDAATRYCDGVARRDGGREGREAGGGPDRKRDRPAGDTAPQPPSLPDPGQGLPDGLDLPGIDDVAPSPGGGGGGLGGSGGGGSQDATNDLLDFLFKP
jgi:hypothetical protein